MPRRARSAGRGRSGRPMASRSSVPHHRMSSMSCNGDRRSTAASSARMSDSRRAAGNRKPVLASSSGTEIWKTQNSSRGQIVGQPTHRAKPAVFLSAEGMCAGPQRKMESPAQRCSPLRVEAVLLQPGQLLAGGRRASRGRWQACSSRRRCGRPDVQVRGGGVVAAAEAVPTVTQPEHNITGRRRRLCHTVGDRSIAPAGPAAIEVARHF
jgi:hypothetical protein